MDANIIREKKVRGDMVVAAKIVDITRVNAVMALNRINSKHHITVFDALSKIISNRENLLIAKNPAV